MPSHCCVPKCTTNYSRSDINVSVFSLPKDPGRRRQWLRAIGRQEYSVGKSSVVCIRHFEEGSVLREDRATRVDGSVLAVPRVRLKLCPTACPSLHLGSSTVAPAQEYRGVRNDASLVPPIRQTASIFKQPVTVYRTQEGKVKADFKHGPQEKPKQLFWEKRLEGLRASDAHGNPLEPMELPRSLRPAGPGVTDETLLQSVATALHVLGQPITGQTNMKPGSDKNPAVFINPDQPLIQAVSISDDDIKRQEERVNLARKRLQEAMKEYDP
ncbi:methyl-CpG-binding domain protein 2 isoform X1 [Halyomorpha halys]|uniref:methyl-CpG-binding domain protein 2 isoform X1 n=1 Tax=Halyomorpha halys TaxID=286706 RepID=UPI0006D4C9B3